LLLAPAIRPIRAETLQEALVKVYQTNPALLAARALLRSTDEGVPQALAGWRPTVVASSALGVQDSHARQLTTYVDPNFPGVFPARTFQRGVSTHTERQTTSETVTMTQPLFRGGRTVAQTRQAENRVYGQRARLLATEQTVLGDAISAYIQMIQAQEVLRLNVNNVQVLSEQLRATNERYRVGEITRTDVAQAEAALAGAQATRAQAEGQLQINRATYTQKVGNPPERLVAPQPLRPPARTAAEAGDVAGRNNPNVVAAIFDEAAARDAIAVQISALLPQMSVQGQAGRTDGGALAHTRTTFLSATLSLSVPLYQGGAEYSAVRAARQSAQQARNLVNDQARTATQQAVAAWEQLQSARAQVESTRVQIRAAEVALDGVQREAIVGSRTTFDVLVQEQNLLNARTSLVQALTSMVSASYILASAIGRLTAVDLGLPVEPYDTRAYYNAVRNRWIGLGDYSNVAERQ
jgi:outer membrane protein